MSDTNRGAWIIASAIVVAALIVVGGIYLLRERRPDPTVPTTPHAVATSVTPATLDPDPFAQAEETVRSLMIAWVQDDVTAALEFASPEAVEVLFQEPKRLRNRWAFSHCGSIGGGSIDCYVVYTGRTPAEFILDMKRSASSAFKVEAAMLFVP